MAAFLRLMLVALLLGPGTLRAQVQPDVFVPDSTFARPPEKLPRELTFIGYAFTRMTTSNVAPTNDLLQGQVIGRLFGPNSTNTSDDMALYTESRFVPFFAYQPRILDQLATFRYLGKVDYTYGDQSYGVGGNRGGSINAGQVNLQTLLANVDLRPSRRWNVVLGLQRIFDNARDPNITAVSEAQSSGYKLAFWGTQGAGISVFARPLEGTRLRAGWYQLYENLVAQNDDVHLFMLDAEQYISPRTELGLDLWWVRDRSRGAGGVSILGQGPGSALADYNGAARLRIPQDNTSDFFYTGARIAFNRDFLAGPLWADAFVIGNFGRIDTVGVKAASVQGFAANASVQYRYGMTSGDRIALETIFTTGDANGVRDGKASGVFTGNIYGSPVGIYSNHRALLLFPDPQVVNRYYSAVHDIGHMGYGIAGFFGHIARDVVPNKVNVKLGAATAFTPVQPLGGGPFVGAEVNAELRVNLSTFLTWNLSAGHVWLGDFYDAPSTTDNGLGKPQNPWIVFTGLSWLMF